MVLFDFLCGQIAQCKFWFVPANPKADAQKPFAFVVCLALSTTFLRMLTFLFQSYQQGKSFSKAKKYLVSWNSVPWPFSCCWIDYSWALWWQIDRISWRSAAQLLPAPSQILPRGRLLQRRHRQRTCPAAMAVLCLQRDPFNGGELKTTFMK